MKMSRIAFLLPGAFLACCSCSSSAKHPSSSAAGSTAADQIAAGKAVYVEHCARCHGDAGQGSKKAPALVGQGALPLDPRPGQKRTGQFHSALDVALFATKNMPPDESDRAALSAPQYWSVLAFALSANGVALEKPVGPDNAAAIVLHP